MTEGTKHQFAIDDSGVRRLGKAGDDVLEGWTLEQQSEPGAAIPASSEAPKKSATYKHGAS